MAAGNSPEGHPARGGSVVIGTIREDGAVVRCPSCSAEHRHALGGGARHAPPCGGPDYRIVLGLPGGGS